MKVKDSQLQKIRRIYKKIVKERSVEGDLNATATGKTAGPGIDGGSGGIKAERLDAKTNYGDLHQAVTRRKYEFAAKAVADAPDVRQARIAEIEARIKAGTYKVDPEKVAEAMIDAGLFDDV